MDAFIDFATGLPSNFPELSLDIKRVIGEGDIVAARESIKTSTEDPGTSEYRYLPNRYADIHRRQPRALGLPRAGPGAKKRELGDLLLISPPGAR